MDFEVKIHSENPVRLLFHLHCSTSPSGHLYLDSEGRVNDNVHIHAFYDFTWSCWRAAVIVVEDEIHFVWLRDVQLVAFRDLLEVRAFVECAAETCLPHGGVGFVFPLPVLALVHGPSLRVRTEMSTNANVERMWTYNYLANAFNEWIVWDGWMDR